MAPTAELALLPPRGRVREAVAAAAREEAATSRLFATGLRFHGAAAFLVLLGALAAVTQDPGWTTYLAPIATYAAIAAALHLGRARGPIARVQAIAGLVDVAFVFLMQWRALPVSPFPAGVAGFSLGLFALLLSLHALALPVRALGLSWVAATIAQLALMQAAGVSAAPMLAAAAVLLFVARYGRLTAQRLAQLAGRAAQAVAERELEFGRFDQLDQSMQTIEAMLGRAREGEERYRAVIEQSSDGIFLCDIETRRLTEANRALHRLLGYSADQLTGRSLTALVIDGPRLVEAWCGRAVLPGGGMAELRLRASDDSVIDVEARASVIRFGDGEALCAVVRDVTARKRAEALEADRRAILERVARNEPLNGTLNQLAHLVEAQLSGTICAAELLRDDGLAATTSLPLPPEMLAHARAAVRRREAGTTHRTLDFEADPSAEPFRGVALNLGLRGCWVVPVGGAADIGFFAVCLRQVREPTREEAALLDLTVTLAQVAIEHRDVTDRLTAQAFQDALTGLPNRRAFEDALARAIDRSRTGASKTAVVCIDLDRFKQINDTLGHAAGDRLLQQVARRLRSNLRKDDLIARMGGDEFMVLIDDAPEPSTAARIVEKLQQAMKEPFVIDGHELFASASMGFSLAACTGADPDEVQRQADVAMYEAKAAGPGNARGFVRDRSGGSLEELTLENELRRAIGNGELRVVYQAEVDTSDLLVAAEALVRWEHPRLGLLPPGKFLHLAEASGLIGELGAWVFDEAVRQVAEWDAARLVPIRVAVNVSPTEFLQPDFVERVRRRFAESGVNPGRFEIELTETVIMRDTTAAAAKLESLRALGVRIAIDDFGTGYSSLAYLQKLPIDVIKIDRSFVSEMENGSRPLVQAIVAIGRSLGLEVVAEGVETAAQCDDLRVMGCERLQGYLFGGPPRSAAAFRQLMTETRRTAPGRRAAAYRLRA